MGGLRVVTSPRRGQRGAQEARGRGTAVAGGHGAAAARPAPPDEAFPGGGAARPARGVNTPSPLSAPPRDVTAHTSPPADYRSQQVARGAPRLSPGSGGRAGPSGRCSPRGRRGSSRTRRVAWWEA